MKVLGDGHKATLLVFTRKGSLSHGETLTSRAGMALFSRYLQNLGLLSLLERPIGRCGSQRGDFRSRSFVTWVFRFFLDGAHFSLVRFDELKRTVTPGRSNWTRRR